MNVAMATACGAKKRQGSWPARSLYESSRIKHLERWCRENRVPFYILSAEHGLISGDAVIASYQRLMDPSRAAELAPQVAGMFGKWDVLVFFKAGAQSSYADCIRLASKVAQRPVALIGDRSMGHVRQARELVLTLRSGESPRPGSIESLELVGFTHA